GARGYMQQAAFAPGRTPAHFRRYTEPYYNAAIPKRRRRFALPAHSKFRHPTTGRKIFRPYNAWATLWPTWPHRHSRVFRFARQRPHQG
ncbi:MAG: hypothetical protein RMM98_18320, partial [Acidobacteriota bacterium]|nr:hypothetical protein [Acidobacteriota bacterium]